LHARESFPDVRDVSSLDDSIWLERSRAPEQPPLAFSSAADTTLHRRANLLICSQLGGIAEAARDGAVAYAKTRQQFGQPIGAFQAVKHECADMAVRCEIVYAQTFFAGLIEGGGLIESEFQSAVAGRLAYDAAMKNARANIQIHGGVGFTAECDAHHYLKRVHLLGQLGGGFRGLRRRLLIDAIS